MKEIGAIGQGKIQGLKCLWKYFGLQFKTHFNWMKIRKAVEHSNYIKIYFVYSDIFNIGEIVPIL